MVTGGRSDCVIKWEKTDDRGSKDGKDDGGNGSGDARVMVEVVDMLLLKVVVAAPSRSFLSPVDLMYSTNTWTLVLIKDFFLFTTRKRNVRCGRDYHPSHPRRE